MLAGEKALCELVKQEYPHQNHKVALRDFMILHAQNIIPHAQVFLNFMRSARDPKIIFVSQSF